MSRCKSCGAPIVWARTATSGRSMPLDAAPTSDGNVVVEAGTARVLTDIEDRPATTYRSHFATCPNATEHRKRTK